MEAALELRESDVVSQYVIYDILGVGSFGNVYKVKDKKSGCKRALKLFTSKNPMDVETARREMRITKMLSEADKEKNRVVEYIGHVAYKGHDCIVMALEPLSLKGYIDSLAPKRMASFQIRMVIKSLLQGLKFLKEQKVIHADLKPHNMLMKSNSGECVIADFSLAHSVTAKPKLYDILQPLRYRAPEVILGFPADFSVDLWSAGWIIFEAAIPSFFIDPKTENELLGILIEMLGLPSTKFLRKAIWTSMFFRKHIRICSFGYEYELFDFEKQDKPTLKTLLYNANGTRAFTDEDGERDLLCTQTLYNLVKNMLKWLPEKRISLDKALKHEFLSN